MSLHLNLSTGKFLNSSTLFKLSDALVLDVSSGEIVMSNLLVPRAVSVSSSPTLFGDAALDLNFASSLSLDDAVSGNNLITFTRASTGTYVDSSGVIQTATTDTPRFDHDPSTGESLGLLIEEARTNSIPESIISSAKGWTVTSITETLNATTAPDGTLTATEYTLTTSSNPATRRVFRFAGTSTLTDYTVTVFAKAGGTDELYMRGIANSGIIKINLISGVVTSNGSTSSVTTTAYTNGWWRISLTDTATDPIVYLSIPTGVAAGGSFYVWGAQVEVGSFPSSYIPTTTSAVTRAADLASITGTNFSSWYNQSEGTVFVEAQAVDGGTSQQLLHTYGNSTTSNRGMYYTNNTNRPSAYWVNAGTNQALLQSSTPTLGFEGNPFKYVAAYNTGDFALGYDGGNLIFDTSGTPDPTIYRASLGSFNATSSFLNGHISRLTYFPTRKPDEDLTSLSLPTVITYGITSPGGEFNLRSVSTVDYEVDWELTGSREASTVNVLPHTYTAGNHTLAVYSDSAYRPYFNNVIADVTQITSVVISSGANLGSALDKAWRGATNMTSFVCPFDVTSGATRFSDTWRGCTNLTSFPLIDTSSSTSFSNTWISCSSLTSFPLIPVSSSTNFSQAWRLCTNLADFPANMFDTTGTLLAAAFNVTWLACALTAQSIENILVSLDTNGATGITLGINGGTNAAKTTWSAAAVTAYDNLIVKGWTISFNA